MQLLQARRIIRLNLLLGRRYLLIFLSIFVFYNSFHPPLSHVQFSTLFYESLTSGDSCLILRRAVLISDIFMSYFRTTCISYELGGGWMVVAPECVDEGVEWWGVVVIR